MSNKEILEKAIQKAIDGGWQPFEFGKPTRIMKWHGDHMINIAIVFPLHKDEVEWVRELEGIIFNHDFAKALWGGDKVLMGSAPNHLEEDGTLWLGGELWKYHLQHMVIADDPIKYLGEHLDVQKED